MSVDINGYSIDVVGINMPCQGRNCDKHPDGCGREVLHVGVVLRIRKQTIMVQSKEEVMLGVFLIENGIVSCKVGFLPRFMLPRAPIFDGAVAQVVQMYGPDDTNKHVRKRWMTMKGYCRAVLLTVMSPLGSTCPMVDYINPEYKRGDTAGPKRKRDNCPDERSI